jgi:hypothetical protein
MATKKPTMKPSKGKPNEKAPPLKNIRDLPDARIGLNGAKKKGDKM